MEYREDVNKRSETFTIGQVSEITGISRDRLRYYEEKGILSPEQNRDNNYRRYSIYDIDNVLSIEFYRSMDLSMKEINDIWASNNPGEIADLLLEKEKEISTKIDEMQLYLRNVEKGREACDKIANNLNRYSIQPMPAFEVLGEISDFRAFSEYKEIHNKKNELEGKSIVNSLRRIITFSEKGIKDNKMLITRSINCNDTTCNKLMKYDRCLYTIVEDSAKNGVIVDEMFEKSIRWANENKLKNRGIVIINIILITVKKGITKTYLEVFAPVE